MNGEKTPGSQEGEPTLLDRMSDPLKQAVGKLSAERKRSGFEPLTPEAKGAEEALADQMAAAAKSLVKVSSADVRKIGKVLWGETREVLNVLKPRSGLDLAFIGARVIADVNPFVGVLASVASIEAVGWREVGKIRDVRHSLGGLIEKMMNVQPSEGKDILERLKSGGAGQLIQKSGISEGELLGVVRRLLGKRRELGEGKLRFPDRLRWGWATGRAAEAIYKRQTTLARLKNLDTKLKAAGIGTGLTTLMLGLEINRWVSELAISGGVAAIVAKSILYRISYQYLLPKAVIADAYLIEKLVGERGGIARTESSRRAGEFAEVALDLNSNMLILFSVGTAVVSAGPEIAQRLAAWKTVAESPTSTAEPATPSSTPSPTATGTPPPSETPPSTATPEPGATETPPPETTTPEVEWNPGEIPANLSELQSTAVTGYDGSSWRAFNLDPSDPGAEILVDSAGRIYVEQLGGSMGVDVDGDGSADEFYRLSGLIPGQGGQPKASPEISELPNFQPPEPVGLDLDGDPAAELLKTDTGWGLDRDGDGVVEIPLKDAVLSYDEAAGRWLVDSMVFPDGGLWVRNDAGELVGVLPDGRNLAFDTLGGGVQRYQFELAQLHGDWSPAEVATAAYRAYTGGVTLDGISGVSLPGSVPETGAAAPGELRFEDLRMDAGGGATGVLQGGIHDANPDLSATQVAQIAHIVATENQLGPVPAGTTFGDLVVNNDTRLNVVTDINMGILRFSLEELFREQFGLSGSVARNAAFRAMTDLRIDPYTVDVPGDEILRTGVGSRTLNSLNFRANNSSLGVFNWKDWLTYHDYEVENGE